MKLNADMGEHEPHARTRALMRLIDLANIACGVHAGSAATMERCVGLAVEHGVQIGAHPGLAADFGRGAADITPAQLEVLLVSQVEDLERFAGARLKHIKLHGALYHAVERSASLARRTVATVQKRFPRCALVTLAGGRVAELCVRAGAPFLAEAFAERGYREDGSLVPRGEPGDVITSPAAVARRVRKLRDSGGMAAESGKFVRIDADTLCVHSDTPNAVRIARAARSVLGPRA